MKYKYDRPQLDEWRPLCWCGCGLEGAPVAVGAGADADEAGGEDGEGEDDGDKGCVHDVVLLWRAEGLPAAQLMVR